MRSKKRRTKERTWRRASRDEVGGVAHVCEKGYVGGGETAFGGLSLGPLRLLAGAAGFGFVGATLTPVAATVLPCVGPFVERAVVLVATEPATGALCSPSESDNTDSDDSLSFPLGRCSSLDSIFGCGTVPPAADLGGDLETGPRLPFTDWPYSLPASPPTLDDAALKLEV